MFQKLSPYSMMLADIDIVATRSIKLWNDILVLNMVREIVRKMGVNVVPISLVYRDNHCNGSNIYPLYQE